MNLTPQNNPKEFENFLFQKINLKLFHYKFLFDYIEAALTGQKKLYDKSVINISDKGWIVILHGEILLIYGENWNSDQFIEISEIVDLNHFKNFSIIGDSKLTNSLLAFYKIDRVEILKERVLYQTQVINEVTVNNFEIVPGDIAHQDELAEMLQNYYHEEYNGKNDKSIEDMQMRIIQVIATGKIFVLKNKQNQILSFCTIIDPDIGILFTKPQFRNQGNGRKLLAHCSNLLLKKNKEVFVMTDKNEIASNKTCISIGFVKYFENVFLQINCD